MKYTETQKRVRRMVEGMLENGEILWSPWYCLEVLRNKNADPFRRASAYTELEKVVRALGLEQL